MNECLQKVVKTEINMHYKKKERDLHGHFSLQKRSQGHPGIIPLQSKPGKHLQLTLSYLTYVIIDILQFNGSKAIGQN